MENQEVESWFNTGNLGLKMAGSLGWVCMCVWGEGEVSAEIRCEMGDRVVRKQLP